VPQATHSILPEQTTWRSCSATRSQSSTRWRRTARRAWMPARHRWPRTPPSRTWFLHNRYRGRDITRDVQNQRAGAAAQSRAAPQVASDPSRPARRSLRRCPVSHLVVVGAHARFLCPPRRPLLMWVRVEGVSSGSLGEAQCLRLRPLRDIRRCGAVLRLVVRQPTARVHVPKARGHHASLQSGERRAPPSMWGPGPQQSRCQ